MANYPDIIQFDDDSQPDSEEQIIVYRHPREDFLTGTQLIVHDSQEAVFFMNGRAMDTFPPGRHTLETQNLPLLGKFLNFGKERTPFHCSVYFINKLGHIAQKWGTPESHLVEYQDPVYHFPLRLAAFGEMHFTVEDSRRLLMKLVGTSKQLSRGQLAANIENMLMMRFKNYMARLMTENNICIFNIDTYLEPISTTLHGVLKDEFTEFGICLERFVVAGFRKPEDDATYREFKDLFYRQYAEVAEAKLQREVSEIGQEGRSASPAEGVCAACGGKLSPKAKFCPHCGMRHDLQAALPQVTCPVCGRVVPQAAFCEECGTQFQVECPGCRAAIPAGSVFCLKCGIRL